ncbi:nucleolar DEAD-box protein required for synthesis of 60S ribosomal subunit [Borealophlyctis nickersoniae]|nr:nucleolar DEAD-box protein required for synthesis of 60S ribosomal subunit [Borealophlyctis nickersoniae]
MVIKNVQKAPFDPLRLGTIEDDDDVPAIDDGEDDEVDNGVEAPEALPEVQKSVVEQSVAKQTKKEKKAAKKLAKEQKGAGPAETRQNGKLSLPTKTNGTVGPAKKGISETPEAPKTVEEEAELNPEFSFEVDGGLSSIGPGHPWDFTFAKAAIKSGMKTLTSVTSIDDKIERKRKEVHAGEGREKKAAKKRKVLEEEDVEVEDGGEVSIGSDGEFIFEGGNGSDDDEELAGSDAEGSDAAEFAAMSSDEDEEGLSAFEDESEGEEEGETDDDDEEDEVTSAKGQRSRSEASDDDGEDPEDIVQNKRKAEYFAAAPEPLDDASTETFTSMRLSRPILKGIAAMGFVKPTTIQSRTIPIALQGLDICGSAVTGSGKTAAFIIPVLERLLFRPKHVATTRVLVLVPTRELGAQCHSVASNLAKFTDIQSALCVGGLSTKSQEAELRKRPDIIIATPGRLIDHIHNSPSFNLDSIEILIMDEADRMLEDGFAAELNEIIKNTPKSRQTMLFSATMTDNVDDLIRMSLNRPVRLFVDSTSSIASRLVQEFIRVRGHREEARPAILAALCSRTYKTETIVFFRSKAAAHHMKIIFGLLGLKAAELHGNLTQLQRLEALELFRDRKVDFLLATDLASRGLDIAGIKTVINYDMPRNYAQYVHRVGRTARADQSGRAVSLVGESDRSVLKLALKNSRDEVKHRIVPAEVVQKYEKRIAKLTDTVKDIYNEEKEEKELKKAEMEVTKASNIIKFADEISGRPAKTWFQSEADKAKSKELGLAKHNADFGLEMDEDDEKPQAGQKRKAAAVQEKPKRGKFDGLSRHKKRLRMSREEDVKEITAQKRSARSAKTAARPTKIQQIAERKPSAAPKPKVHKGSTGFDAEIVKGKKAKEGRGEGKAVPKGKDKEVKKRDHRLGKQQSRKAFKSKAKHKRRK